ncbi:exported hypothetical protein [Candidatus Sulfopaludibacter sp. SbA3]|nr:exported hypothetical protein [Candidatus Sulfopaludibacter sp. SbA3]
MMDRSRRSYAMATWIAIGTMGHVAAVSGHAQEAKAAAPAFEAVSVKLGGPATLQGGPGGTDVFPNAALSVLRPEFDGAANVEGPRAGGILHGGLAGGRPELDHRGTLRCRRHDASPYQQRNRAPDAADHAGRAGGLAGPCGAAGHPGVRVSAGEEGIQTAPSN